MATIKAFRAFRPPRHLADKVAALPYDVMSTEEARAMVEGNPYSFLHISRPEVDLPADVDIHSDPVYEQGMTNFSRFIAQGTLIQDQGECFYVYRQKMGALTQTGLVVCSSVDDYQSNVIRKHELTRADKEEDRVRHIDCLDANDEPVFYTYRNVPGITATVDGITRGEPAYDFTTEDGVSHTLWVVEDPQLIAGLTAAFADIPTLYVADGHHRSAAASRVRDMRRDANPSHDGTEEYNYFLTVIFPDNEMNIMPYNRVVKDLAGLELAGFMARISEHFEVTPLSQRFVPVERHTFGMFLEGRWYSLAPRQGVFDENDAVARLDVSILQEQLLSPVLKIRNPRIDQRIHFVGGIRGTDELERLVQSGEYAVAFALYPTSMEELMALADADKIMPPKSTWFEPKLRSGLFLHILS